MCLVSRPGVEMCATRNERDDLESGSREGKDTLAQYLPTYQGTYLVLDVQCSAVRHILTSSPGAPPRA
jgi:hypothetical protein